jgi:predicted lipid-binding transport protein (Tim44 family)
LAASLLVQLVVAAQALAAAGGGSSSFGGGGGGGGSFGGGGGGGSYGGGGGSSDGGGLGLLVSAGFVVLFIAGLVAFYLLRQAWHAADRTEDRMRWAVLRRRRVPRVEAAAAEAAGDDAAFEPERVRTEAEALFRQIQAAWSRNDVDRLDGLVGPELMKEWRRRLKDFKRKGWKNQVTVVDDVRVDYAGLVNRADDAEDRVVVRIDTRVKDVVLNKRGGRKSREDSLKEVVPLSEWWTLSKRDGRWILLSIEQADEGEHHERSDLVTLPEGDAERIRHDAVMELADDGKVADGFSVADVAEVDFDGDARAAALDLSLADARFGPDVLETAVRRAVAAWAEAVDGDDAELTQLATPEAVGALLHPGDPSRATRLVVRGPQVRAVRITGLDAQTTPASLAVEVEVSGRRYVENRDTLAVVSGSKDGETRFTERWTLTLDGSDGTPWRISAASAETLATKG